MPLNLSEREKSILDNLNLSPDLDLLTQLALAQQALVEKEVENVQVERVTKETADWKVESLHHPESNIHGIFWLSFSSEKAVQHELIPVYSQLMNDRIRAGFDTFYVGQSPRGTTELSTLAHFYYRAFRELPPMKIVSAVDDSQIENNWLMRPKIVASFAPLMKLLDVKVRLLPSRDLALEWLKEQQKQS